MDLSADRPYCLFRLDPSSSHSDREASLGVGLSTQSTHMENAPTRVTQLVSHHSMVFNETERCFRYIPAGDPRSAPRGPHIPPGTVSEALCATCMRWRLQIGAGIVTDGRVRVWWGRQGERCTQEPLAAVGPIRRARARGTLSAQTRCSA